MEKCSKIYITNHAAVVAQWSVIVQSVTIYTTDKYSVGKGVTIDLSEICNTNPKEFPNGIQFYIKSVVVAGDDSSIEETLEYDADSNRTVSFELKGTAFKTWTNKVS